MLMADQKNAIDIIENLIETCRDGQNGFRDAAEHVKDPSIREMFNRYSLERAKFAGELEAFAQRLGKADPDRTGSTVATFHRAWIDFKANIGLGDEGVISAAETGEDSAKKAYEEALGANLPSDVRDTVEPQAQSVFRAHDEVRNLRDRLKAA
jgi:uncharacterized protein (TIGR02284 family)